MKTRTARLAIVLAVSTLVVVYAAVVIRRGFSATGEPSVVEKGLARAIRNLGIPRHARDEKSPVPAAPAALEAGRNRFTAQCANCHGRDGGGITEMGRGLYPKPPDLQSAATRRSPTASCTTSSRTVCRSPGWPPGAIRTRRWMVGRSCRSSARCGLSPAKKTNLET